MAPDNKKLYVSISLDVEEEGLFSGKYPSRNPSVANVALLRRLLPLKAEFGLPPTLFCAHSVLCDPRARETLAWMRDYCGAEIGAHLHHWSTPPFSAREMAPPTRTHLLPADIFIARLQSLLNAAGNLGPLTSFRMGRWDLKSALLPVLAENGIQVDSSICPLREFKDGPDHFLAPADPYWINLGNGMRILEAPITQIPVSGLLARLWKRLAPGAMRDCFHYFGAMSANPFWHGAKVARWASRLHHGRGGKVLCFFWHSSEMLPGASPHVPDQLAVDAMLARIFSFCGWLNANFCVVGVTASQLPSLGLEFPDHFLARGRDW